MRPEEAVGAVVRDRHGLDGGGPQRLHLIAEAGRKVAPVGVQQAGHVLADEPERRRDRGIPGEHDAAPRHPAQLRAAGAPVAPVVDGEHGQRGVEPAIGERQVLGRRGEARRCAGRPLRAHHGRRLHRHDIEVGRLVAARAGAHVDDAMRVAQRRPDLRGDARVWSPLRRVTTAEHVVVAGHADVLHDASHRERRPRPPYARAMSDRTVGITRKQALAFRVSRHHLAERLGEHGAKAAAVVGLQDTPPGSAALSLAARAEVAADGLDELVLVPSIRGAPLAVAAEDLAIFTAGLDPPDEEAARVVVGNAWKALDATRRRGRCRRACQ